MTEFADVLRGSSLGDWHLLGMSTEDAENACYALVGSEYSMYHIRGNKAKLAQELFNEVSAVFQFPTYFGENGAALYECIQDLLWLDLKNNLILLILQADQILLREEKSTLGGFVDILKAMVKSFSIPISLGELWDRDAVQVHVVLQCSPGYVQLTQERWSSQGAQLRVFNG
jgi:RNAse (barnase) inhibitor barstar